MFVTVLPLRGMMFQALFLLIAIALESFILHKNLNLSPRTSIECSASLNLFSTIVGWLVIFSVDPLLPEFLKRPLFNFILFGTPTQIKPYSLFMKIVYLLLYRLSNLLFALVVELLFLELLATSFYHKFNREIKQRSLSESPRNQIRFSGNKPYGYYYDSLKSRSLFLANFCSNLLVTFLILTVI